MEASYYRMPVVSIEPGEELSETPENPALLCLKLPFFLKQRCHAGLRKKISLEGHAWAGET